nr:solute carrier family 49 member 4 homolog [Procambarus clarkii]
MDESGTKRENKDDGMMVYLRRFWILGIFSFLSLFQSLQWCLWGPLSESVNAAFEGWGSGTVAMMSNWASITYVLCVAPLCWLMSTRGLRVGVVTCVVLVATGGIIRIISFTTDSDEFFTVTCHIAAVLNGIAGPLIMSTPPMIAAEWFPPKERTTAMAACQLMTGLGMAGSYLEALVVRAPTTGVTSSQIKSDIRKLLYFYAGVGVALLIAILVYFPKKPPTPPSITSSVERLNFKISLRKLIRRQHGTRVAELCGQDAQLQMRRAEIEANKEVELRRVERGLVSVPGRQDDLKARECDTPTCEPLEAEAFFKISRE